MIKVALALIVIIFSSQVASSISLGKNVTLNYNNGQWDEDGNNPFQGSPSFTSDVVKCPDTSSISSEIIGPGQLRFAWKKDSNTTQYLNDYTNFSFYINDTLKASCDKSSWGNKSFELGNGSHLVKWEFKLDRTGNDGCPRSAHGQGWIAYIDYIPKGNIFSPSGLLPSTVPSAPKLNQAIVADMPDLQRRVEKSSDLMGVTLLLGDRPYDGNLIINAKNFTLEPNDGRKGEINGVKNNEATIKLNNTSHVTISKLDISGKFCGISLEKSKNCVIEANTIEAIDGWGIYLCNSSIHNTISKNIITSRGHSNDQPIVIIHSDNNEITCNNVIYAQSSHYYLHDSYQNKLMIHRLIDDFYIETSHYNLGQDLVFYRLIDSGDPSRIYGDPTTTY